MAVSRTRSVGDIVEFADGSTATIIEVSRATDANGVVTFDEPDVSLRVQKIHGVALANVSDDLFAAYVLQAGGAYAVGVYHPGLGERVFPAPLTAKPLNVIMRMTWACPSITIKHAGVAQVGEFVSFQLIRHSKEGGLLRQWFGADRFPESAADDGEWETDANGVVKQNYDDGTGLHAVYFPCGEGAIFQRPQDRRDEQADAPEEYMTELWCYHKAAKVRVEEGQDVEIDLLGGSIDVSGDANAKAYAWLEDTGTLHTPDLWGALMDSVTLDGSGQGTMTGLLPGKYVVVQRAQSGGADDWTYISPRASVEVPVTGSVGVGLSPLVQPEEGKCLLYVYEEGATPGTGCLYHETEAAETPTLMGEGSVIEFDWDDFGGQHGVVTGHGTGFHVSLKDAGTCYEATCKGRFLTVGIDDAGAGIETVWWTGGYGHRDFQTLVPHTYLMREKAGSHGDLSFIEVQCGAVSEATTAWPEPTWVYDPEMATGSFDWATDYVWQLVEQDGTVVLDDLPTGERTGLHGSGAQEHDEQRATYAIAPALHGGKLSGNEVSGSDAPIKG